MHREAELHHDLRTPKTGSGTESGEVTVATWQYYDLMHKVLGARPTIDPPVLVSSIQEDPMVILMEMVEPYNQAPPTAASTPVHPPTTSIMRRRSKTVAELLAEEALQEQRRHEEIAFGTLNTLDTTRSLCRLFMARLDRRKSCHSSAPSSRHIRRMGTVASTLQYIGMKTASCLDSNCGASLFLIDL
ncbi:unnamed protein product [Gadus morhua 'NCC']